MNLVCPAVVPPGWLWSGSDFGPVAYGMGCAWIGRTGEAGRERDLRLLHEAHASGCRFFDTAPSYAESQTRLGEFVREIDRDSVVLSTKAEGGKAMWTDPKQWLKDAAQQSCEALQTERIDLFLLHDGACEVLLEPEAREEALNAVRELRDAGRIARFGAGVKQHDWLRVALGLEEVDAVLSYGECTPVESGALPLARECSAAGKIFLNGSPLMSGGLLAGLDPRTVPTFADAALVERAAAFYDFCQARDFPVLRAALHYPLRWPEIGLTLTGPSQPEQLASFLEALRAPMPNGCWEEWEEQPHPEKPPIH